MGKQVKRYLSNQTQGSLKIFHYTALPYQIQKLALRAIKQRRNSTFSFVEDPITNLVKITGANQVFSM